MVALVTGASSGIGAAAARRLAPTHRLVLVARRQDRLDTLAAELGGATVVAADLTQADAPARIAAAVEEAHGRLDLLVNNAGAGWRARFADGGSENVRRHMAVNFDAPMRLTEALLPLLRRSAPSAVVNVASVAGRLGRGNSGGYSASKFALIGWSESLHLEEREHGVHIGVVLPGFVVTEGFPQRELAGRATTRWLLSSPEKVADAIADVAGGKPERYVPRAYAIAAAARILLPGVVRRLTGGGGPLTPATSGDVRSGEPKS